MAENNFASKKNVTRIHRRAFTGSLEDLLGLTDSEESPSSSSSNSGMFDKQQPLILELHELKKDEPSSDNPPQDLKVKKIKKKKRKSQAKTHISMSSDSQSEGVSLPPLVDTTEDEFYDAHESYHALSDGHVTKPVTAAAGLLPTHSEHSQDPKTAADPAISPSVQQTTAPPKAPSTITANRTHNQILDDIDGNIII